jgi:hypothetical protein
MNRPPAHEMPVAIPQTKSFVRVVPLSLPFVFRFHTPGDAAERMMYGWSVVHCLPVAMADQPSETIGTGIPPRTLRRLARDAGFGHCEGLAIGDPLFRFYRLGA